MGFVVTNKMAEQKMYPGMIITYKVSPVLGIKMNWVTEITQVKELEYFVDEQRIGPYAMWHHEHKIEAIEGGVLMTDIVLYRTNLLLVLSGLLPIHYLSGNNYRVFLTTEKQQWKNNSEKQTDKYYLIYLSVE